MMKPSFVILAAGLGSRYGGLKQLEPVGPDGSTIMDYTVFDAIRAGFGRIVFVISPAMEAAFPGSVGRRFEPHVPVGYACQRLDALPAGFDVPPGRARPWGTGQAVLAAREAVDGPFAVANADDFYGAHAFAMLGAFLQRPDDTDPTGCAMVAFALRDTLTEAGTVNRAVCRCGPDGRLLDIVEIKGIEKHGGDGRYTDERGVPRVIGGDEPVSMNAWGFRPAVFDPLDDGFRRFVATHGASGEAEFHLPTAIQAAIHDGLVRVKVLPSKDTWCGMTHPGDKSRVVEVIRHRIDRGDYPRVLWGP